MTDVPEEQKSCVDENTQSVLAMLRFGGPNGNPRGLYPAAVVQDVWDRIVRRPDKGDKPGEVSLEQYANDSLLLDSRDIPGAEFFLGDGLFGRAGVILFDLKTKRLYDIPEPRAHNLPASEYVCMIPVATRGLKRSLYSRASFLVHGVYFHNQRDHQYFGNIATQVVLLPRVNSQKHINEELLICDNEPWRAVFMALSFAGYQSDEIWDLTKESLTEKQKAIIEPRIAKIRLAYSHDTEILRLLEEGFLKKPRYIFITQDGEAMHVPL